MTKPEILSFTDPKEIHAQSRKSGLTKHIMMRGPSYRSRGLDTYSVEAVPQATKVRGIQPKGV